MVWCSRYMKIVFLFCTLWVEKQNYWLYIIRVNQHDIILKIRGNLKMFNIIIIIILKKICFKIKMLWFVI